MLAILGLAMIGKLQITQGFGVFPPLAALLDQVKRHKMLSSILAVLLIAAIVAGSVVAARSTARTDYQTQTVVQQDLTQTVTASGTVNPQNTVLVGTQVSGTISAIYVDYNSRVHKGQVLARIDTSQFQAQLDQSQAALAQAQAQASAQQRSAGGAQSSVTVAQANSDAQNANVQASQAAIATADANVAKSQSAMQVAEQTFRRDQALLSKGYIAQSQYDADQSNAVAAQSALKSAQAAATQARAQAASTVSTAQASAAQTAVNVAQAAASQDTAQASQAAVAAAQAQVAQNRLNIDRAVITSPVDGTVIARNVSVGQTVASSLTTPTLFNVAQDLKKMEVDISVGEPDIGNVRPGDTVNFSVLAYPNEIFHGTVSQVRENPTTISNVVTYTVITNVANPQNKLLPGMTANATINVQTAHNALVIPTQALSFHPTGLKRGTHRRAPGAPAGGAASTASSPWGQTGAGVTPAAMAGGSGMIFVSQNGNPHPVRVRVDLISGSQAAVTPLRGNLSAGDSVIVSSGSGSSAHGQFAGSRNPSGIGASPGGMGSLGRAIH